MQLRTNPKRPKMKDEPIVTSEKTKQETITILLDKVHKQSDWIGDLLEAQDSLMEKIGKLEEELRGIRGKGGDV